MKKYSWDKDNNNYSDDDFWKKKAIKYISLFYGTFFGILGATVCSIILYLLKGM